MAARAPKNTNGDLASRRVNAMTERLRLSDARLRESIARTDQLLAGWRS
ncbi:MAG: hypothetical protein ABSC51_01520 [Gaiellaceae bacterium]|jgi:hypothetical protein